MKREIKFRGKRADNGEWIYGDLIINKHNRPYIFLNNYLSYDYGLWFLVNDVGAEVLPETVGQYTQLKDKNGLEIFEGDLLKIDDGDPVEVRYEGIYASFGIWRNGFSFLHYFHEYIEPENCEVIGNIHDLK